MKPDEVKKIKSRIIATIAEELGGSVEKGTFSRHAKSIEYSLYGKGAFISDAPKAVKQKK